MSLMGYEPNEMLPSPADKEIIRLRLENIRLKEQLKEILGDLNQLIKEREKK